MAKIAIALFFAQVVATPMIGESPVAVVADRPRLEAIDSTNFTFGTPRLDLHGTVTHLEGVVCRRANHVGLSPEKVRIERIGSDGAVGATKFAFLPPLSRRLDQRCGRFGVPLDPPPQPGETIRICLARSGACAAPG